MEEQINNLLIDLVVGGMLEPKDSGDLKTVLMQNIPVELVKQSNDFLKRLKGMLEIETAEMTSKGGLDIAAITSMTKEMVSKEEESIQKNQEEVQKREIEREDAINSMLADYDEKIENDKIPDNDFEDLYGDDVDIEVDEATRAEIDEYIANKGLVNIDNEEAAKNAASFKKVSEGMSSEDIKRVSTSMADKKRFFYQAVKLLNAGRNLKDILKIVNINAPAPNQDEKCLNASIVASQLIKSFFNEIKKRQFNGPVDILSIDREGLINDFFDSLEMPVSIEIREAAIRIFEKTESNCIDETSSPTKAFGEKKQVYNMKKVGKIADKSQYSAPFWATMFGKAKDAFREMMEPKNVDSKRERVEEVGKKIYSNQLDFNKAMSGDETSLDRIAYFVKNDLTFRKEMFNARESLNCTIDNSEYSNTNEEKTLNEKRNVLVKNVILNCLASGESICDHYFEMKDIMDSNDVSIDDLYKGIIQLSGDNQEIYRKTIAPYLDKEKKIFKNRLNLQVAEITLKKITGKTYDEIRNMSEEEYLAFKKSLPIENKDNFDKAESLAKVSYDSLNIQREDLSTYILKKIPDNQFDSFIEQVKDDKDYIGILDDAKNGKSDEDRLRHLNKLIEDRNAIAKIQKNQGISKQDAALQYFKINENALSNYSEAMVKIINGDDPTRTFDVSMLDEVIAYQNTLVYRNKQDEYEAARNQYVDVSLYQNVTYKSAESSLILYWQKKNELRKSRNIAETVGENSEEFKQRRKDDFEEMFTDYIFRGNSANTTIEKFEKYKDDNRKTIDFDEFVEKLSKRFDSLVPGSGERIAKREYDLLTAELRIQACKAALETAKRKGDTENIKINEIVLDREEKRRAELHVEAVADKKLYSNALDKSGGTRDDDSQIGDLTDKKVGINPLNVVKVLQENSTTSQDIAGEITELNRIARSQDEKQVDISQRD